MFTRLTVLLLLLCSVSVSLSGLFVFAGFEMNRTYVAKELCVNRNKPQLHCNGNCYLMRKLRQAQEKEQKQDHQFQKIQLQQAIVSQPFIFRQYLIQIIQLRVPYNTGMPVAQVNTIFQPPQSA
ncbi:hypothetical protein [Pedobacter sp. L105]|uniref:hypothetical protein n=1 Tax=Pedobacter sp. L105 TaxID=1641871 RepID=UPI00131ABD6C|nr:hypothetical protein [Pedobacter sp. L105]